MLFKNERKNLKSEIFSLFDEKVENIEKENRDSKKVDKRKKKKEKRHKSIVVNVIKNRKNHNMFVIILALLIGLLLDLLRIIKNFIVGVLFVILLVALIGGIYAYTEIRPIYKEYSEFAQKVVYESAEDTFKIDASSYVYDADGNLLAKLRADKDSNYIEYSEIPEAVVDAFIAVEDRTFWENEGIDIKGIVRVVVDAIKTKGDEMHGASTITQQLARNIFLTHEVSIERKAKEMLIAMALTDKYSKEDIMEFYVNDICYGNAYYGIEAASRGYFNKSVSELTLSQQVYLTALPNSPTYYDPYKNPERAITRRDKILGDMLECGYITQEQYNVATQEEITIEKREYEFNDYQSSYAIDCATKYLMKLNGFEFKYKFKDNNDYLNYSKDYDKAYDIAKDMLYNGGYEVYTTLDSDVQKKAQEILDEHLSFNMEINYDTGIYNLQGSAAIVDNSNGKVVALIGGREQNLNSEVYSLNRAFQSPRQPGSSIKPLIAYGPALENGYTPESLIPNIDVSKAKEKGADIDKIGGQQMTFRSALEQSKNGVAWYLFTKLTPNVGMSYLNNMKFENIVPNDYFPAASLGGLTYGTTTVEMASAYATLANHGVYRDVTCISKMIDNNGDDIYRDSSEVQVYKAKAADALIDVMKGVLTNGTARSLNWPRISKTEAAAKTGTTNDNKDGWLCGMTPYYSVAVWVGYDIPKTMPSLWGNSYPGLIWKDIMVYLTKDLPAANFEDAIYLPEELEELNKFSDTYYTYMPGRDDAEVLSAGYTVADYRTDRVIGETVTDIINKMKLLDRGTENYNDELEKLYNDALLVIDTIYSRNYTNERTGELNAVYEDLKSKVAETSKPEVQEPEINEHQVQEPTVQEPSAEVQPDSQTPNQGETNVDTPESNNTDTTPDTEQTPEDNIENPEN